MQHSMGMGSFEQVWEEDGEKCKLGEEEAVELAELQYKECVPHLRFLMFWEVKMRDKCASEVFGIKQHHNFKHCDYSRGAMKYVQCTIDGEPLTLQWTR